MKHFIHKHPSVIAAILSLMALCGCTNTEVDAPAPPQDKLYFNVALDGRTDQQGTTRAYTGDIDFASRGFTVAGYRTNGEFSTIDPNSLPFPNVFDYLNPGVDDAVITVKRDGTEANTNRQYWATLPRLPLSNVYNISYFAWSSSQPNTITAATSSATDKGAPWIDAKVGTAATSQPDIVGAMSMNHSNEYTVSAIDFDFKHLLSKMSFMVKTSNGMTANITGVQCVYGASAVYSEARFTFDGTAEVGTWSDHKTYLNAGAVTPTGWNSTVTTATSALLGSMTFIPQSLADDALSLNITYTTTQGGVTSNPTTRNVSLKALDMKPGKNYIYTLDVNANEIAVFNVKVEGWIEIAGTDKGLPLVPGAMDPDVLLLLEGIDPPYTTADGNKYWLDRSGWNRHCLILDKMHYSGANSFDITYDGTKRGYVFHRGNFAEGKLYNHIKIPYLGDVTGNIGCEIVCHNQSTDVSSWLYPTPLSISQGDRGYGDIIGTGRTLLIHINENNKNAWDYANNTDPTYGGGGERITIESNALTGHNWNRLSFYGYSRINGSQKFCIIDNTNSSSILANNNATSYPLKHGMIGAVFNGIINYVKIVRKPLSFDNMMSDYSEVAKKYYIKTTPGIHAPKVSGLLACWDARTGLVQGAANGDGAYWMDQSGNGYYLRATVPSGVNGKFTASSNHILSESPKYDKKGIYMELLGGIEGKYSSITIETVSMSIDGSLNFFMSILDKNNKRIVWARPNTGGGTPAGVSKGVEINSHLVSDPPGGNPPGCQLYVDATATCDRVRRSLVYTIDFINKNCKIYLNGDLYGSKDFSTQDVPNPIFEIERIVLFNQESFNQAFTGEVNAFRIYNRELSASEIKTNYNADRSSFSFNP